MTDQNNTSGQRAVVFDFHKGFTHSLEDGAVVYVNAEPVGRIALVIDYPGEGGAKVMLTPDEALQVATSLLREQNLERFGHV